VAKLDKERRLVAERVKKFEKTAHEIHVMADKLHKKMEKLHRETIATRERARKAREQAHAKGTEAKKVAGGREPDAKLGLGSIRTASLKQALRPLVDWLHASSQIFIAVVIKGANSSKSSPLSKSTRSVSSTVPKRQNG